jgi:hypothetical protein
MWIKMVAQRGQEGKARKREHHCVDTRSSDRETVCRGGKSKVGARRCKGEGWERRKAQAEALKKGRKRMCTRKVVHASTGGQVQLEGREKVRESEEKRSNPTEPGRDSVGARDKS